MNLFVMTITLKVPSIACGGCADTITKAIAGEKPEAKVSVDVEAKMVTVEASVSTVTNFASTSTETLASGFSPAIAFVILSAQPPQAILGTFKVMVITNKLIGYHFTSL